MEQQWLKLTFYKEMIEAGGKLPAGMTVSDLPDPTDEMIQEIEGSFSFERHPITADYYSRLCDLMGA